MALLPRSLKASDSPSLFQAAKWQKIQNLFAKIIGANITLLDSAGLQLTPPSRVTGFCSEIAIPLDPSSAAPVDCAALASQNIVKEKQSHTCIHHFQFWGFEIGPKRKNLGTLLIGPVLVGRREEEPVYRSLCRELKLREEDFLDRVREIKLFSQTGISTVLDFLKEIIESFLKFASQERELKRLLAGFLSKPKGTTPFFSSVYSGELADSLLEIALGVVGGNSGSVLLFDKKGKHFYIKTARGIRSEIAKEVRIPWKEGVAGWVAARGKPILIQKKPKDTALGARLRRPEIHASFVIPMIFRDRTLGVFCVNAESANKKFNPDNLLLLDQLSKLASIALGRLGTE